MTKTPTHKHEKIKSLIAYLANAIHECDDLRCDTTTALEVAEILAREAISYVATQKHPLKITLADLAAAEPLTTTRTLTAWIDFGCHCGMGVGYEDLDYEVRAMLDSTLCGAILDLPGAERWGQD